MLINSELISEHCEAGTYMDAKN